MQNDLDVKEFCQCFQNESTHEYGKFYSAEISDELYKNCSYHSINTFVASNLRFHLREVQERATDNYRSGYGHKVHGAVVTTSPYDFHGLVEPAVEWTPVTTIEGTVLADASFDKKIVEEDICFTGKATVFNSMLLKALPNRRIVLPAATAPKKEYTLIEDPTIVEILKEEAKAPLRVITSVKCLAAISVSNRSVCPFELVFEKRGNDVFVYQRADNSTAVSESTIETITVPQNLRSDDSANEFIERIPESSDIAAQFIAAARTGNKSFQLGEDVVIPGEERANPYVYRRFLLDNIEIIVRCEIDCLKKPVEEGERPKLAICRTFNDLETDLKNSNWAQDLVKSKSNLIISEVKDNGNSFARWTAIGRLMDCSQIYLAFAQRKNSKNVQQHYILSSERQSYERSSSIISLTEKNMFGNIYLVFSKLIGQKEGIYHFQRDVRRRAVKIYIE